MFELVRRIFRPGNDLTEEVQSGKILMLRGKILMLPKRLVMHSRIRLDILSVRFNQVMIPDSRNLHYLLRERSPQLGSNLS